MAIDELKPTMLDSLAEAQRLRDDGQSIAAARAFGEALEWYYSAAGRERAPKWLTIELGSYAISPSDARKLRADYRRSVAEAEMSEAMSPEAPALRVVEDVEVEMVDLDTHTARELTDRIKAGLVEVTNLIVAAYHGRAWIALGYTSWSEYCRAEFDGAPLLVPREDREEMVNSLRAEGFSIRAIAAATRVDPKTIQKDIAAVGISHTSTVTGTDGKRHRASRPKPEVDPGTAQTKAIRAVKSWAAKAEKLLDSALEFSSIGRDNIEALTEIRDDLIDAIQRISAITTAKQEGTVRWTKEGPDA